MSQFFLKEGGSYPFSHNHGSVENCPKSKETAIGDTYTHFSLNHNCGRKGTRMSQEVRKRLVSGL